MLDPRNAFGCPLLVAVSGVQCTCMFDYMYICIARANGFGVPVRWTVDEHRYAETSQRFISSSGKRQDKT